MFIKTYHIDAFANHVFAGNPAMVCLLEHWLPDHHLQAIAAENHLPATAFLVQGNGNFHTRWFTPEYEIDLCGHGTLALGYVIFNKIDPTLQEVEIHSPAGLLRIKRNRELITLDFPAKQIEPSPAQELLIQGLGELPNEIYQHKSERCLVIFNSEDKIRQLEPNIDILKQLEYRGIIISAKGRNSDFVSRVFYPMKLISEDAVTGSSHCLLVPYWAKQLNKTTLHSRQLSHRSGELLCELVGDRVFLSGKAALYMEGSIFISFS